MASATPDITERVIKAFGNLSKMADALGHRNVSTVHGWKKKGRIPNWRRHEIIAAAKSKNINLPVEFLEEEDAA